MCGILRLSFSQAYFVHCGQYCQIVVGRPFILYPPRFLLLLFVTGFPHLPESLGSFWEISSLVKYWKMILVVEN